MNSRTFTQIPIVMTDPHPCNYLSDKIANSIFIAPDFPVSNEMHSLLLRQGFRRSGDYLYKPSCHHCSACQSARILCHDFTPSKRLKRVLRKNSDLTVSIRSQHYTEEYFELYFRYLDARHQDGGMYPPTPQQFKNFLLSDWCDTQFIEFRLAGKLIAVSVVDKVDDGLSALYTFFEPTLADRSLGTFAILWQTEYCKQQNLDFVYLGYWIETCKKMAYKQEYQPLQLFIDPFWIDFEQR